MTDLPEFETEIDIDSMPQKDVNRFIVKQLVTINKQLKPITDTYQTASRVANALMAVSVFISVTLGAFWAVTKIFHKP